MSTRWEGLPVSARTGNASPGLIEDCAWASSGAGVGVSAMAPARAVCTLPATPLAATGVPVCGLGQRGDRLPLAPNQR
jgi:hypothetical protein